MADKKNTLSQEFDRIQGKIDTLFRPIYDPIDEFFFKLVGEFQKAGVDFLEINHGKKSAIAKHSNYYEYPERRYAVTVNDNNKVKFYELEFSNNEAGSSPAKEIPQKEFEDLTIPTYLKPNPLMSKEDQEQDKTPDEANYPEGSKKKDDKDAITKENPKDHPEIKKKNVNYGDTLAPKNKIKEMNEEAQTSYTGTVGNLGPMEGFNTTGYDWMNKIPRRTVEMIEDKVKNGLISREDADEILSSIAKSEGTKKTSAVPAPGLTDGRPGDEVEGMYEDRASQFVKDKQGISITKDQRKGQELRKKKDAKKKSR